MLCRATSRSLRGLQPGVRCIGRRQSANLCQTRRQTSCGRGRDRACRLGLRGVRGVHGSVLCAEERLSRVPPWHWDNTSGPREGLLKREHAGC